MLYSQTPAVGADVDDAAAGRGKVRDHGSGHENNGAHIEVIDMGEVRSCNFCGRTEGQAGSVIDEDIYLRTETLGDVLNDAGRGGRVAEVGAEELNAGTIWQGGDSIL